MIRKLSVLAVLLFATACVMPQPTVLPGERVEMGFYSVDPQIEWNRAYYTVGETWTIDGYGLQSLRFIVVPDGQSLSQKRSAFGKVLPPDEKTPVFRKSMTPNEVQEFFVETLAQNGWTKIKPAKLAPAKFGSLPGFRYSFSMLNGNGLEFKGLAYGVMKDDELYLIVYTGTRLHYFPRYEKDVEKLFASIRT